MRRRGYKVHIAADTRGRPVMFTMTAVEEGKHFQAADGRSQPVRGSLRLHFIHFYVASSVEKPR
jgi:hypothetical protein